MNFTNEYVNKQTMLAIYLVIFLSGAIGLITVSFSDINAMIPQMITALTSLTFYVYARYKSFSKKFHLFTVFYYVVLALPMWIYLGSAHTLYQIYNVIVIIMVVLTLKGKSQRNFLVFISTVYVTYYMIDILFRTSNDVIVINQPAEFMGLSVMIIGIVFVMVFNKRFIDGILLHLKDATRYDGLTNVRNSRAFYEDIVLIDGDFERYQTNYTLVYMDLDKFKDINDTYGHSKGDEALQVVSDFLKKSIRKTDEIYRFGGDEFVILFRHVDRIKVKKKMVQFQEELNKLTNFDFDINLSYGIAERKMYYNLTIPQLLNEADKLMYQDKRNH